jgi:hypothetical protein
VLTIPSNGGDPVAVGDEGSQFPVWQPIVSFPFD